MNVLDSSGFMRFATNKANFGDFICYCCFIYC